LRLKESVLKINIEVIVRVISINMTAVVNVKSDLKINSSLSALKLRGIIQY